MGTLVVEILEDVVANDGKLSLREAIDRAGAGDVITFKSSPEGVVTLDRSIVIENGKSVTIDGGGDVRISAIQSAIVVEDGAALTLRDVNLQGGVNGAFSTGAGTQGADGEHGAQGQGAQQSGQSGTKGGDGEGGEDGGKAADAGDAGGLLQNFGAVTLDHVQIHGTGYGGGAAPGGGGGRGGWGGLGGYGLGGGNGADGGDAGDGGHGGDGGDGGDAIGSIYNAGELTLIDSVIGGTAQGRDGGVGVFGGDGGRGGYGGNAGGGNGGNGGDGGHGGDGGDGGDGGTAVSAILNDGEITVIGAALINGAVAEAGLGGLGGRGGLGGDRGLGGNQNGEGPRGLDGKDGEDGVDGAEGRDGDAFDVLDRGDIDGKLGFDAHFFEFGGGAGVPSGISVENKAGARTEFSATVTMVGDGFDEASVQWRLVVDGGLKAADFVGGKLPTGKLTFEGDGSVTAEIEFALKAGVKLPKDTSFDIVLFNPSKGDFLGSGFTVSADIFRVTAGADKVGGTKGDDDLSGLGGSDTLAGGAGDDSLDGGAGADRLTGGGGADLFEFARKTDSVQASRDVIVGFSQKDGDAIDLLFDADETERGVQDFTFRGEKGFNDVGQIRFEYDSRQDVTRVEANLDGDKQAEFTFDVAGRVKLTADDFLI
ncbi:calcium-binding protein [Hansschlegelia zhihuaiae]|uniref:Peptidase M10 serralysin C-terminal domain-containing protein n=1 Tax=Hansschlegelia zhihuaiae TaxID=405005 RepID=A0A4Q0MH65_9HYPH|nr:hypothetical protein [Hansschlegelia zhihuaiae]RXF72725.1 hypothetical protein EK403_14295 [Hansschlegelia zhihuaiae]